MSDKVVVTGGAGFIGSHLVNVLLRAGYEVHSIDLAHSYDRGNLREHERNPRLVGWADDLAQASERDLDYYFRGARYVFHIAGRADQVPSVAEPRSYYEANVTATLNVLEAARRASCVEKLVYAASSSCYGAKPVSPTRESAPCEPHHPYALTKYLGEQMAMYWGQMYDLPVISLRMFSVYGPRVHSSGVYGQVLGILMAQRAHGMPLTVVDPGSQTRDFVHVEDVCRAYLLAATTPRVRQKVFNVGSGVSTTINWLARLIGGEGPENPTFAGGYPIKRIPPRPGEVQSTMADICEIKRCLGWAPTISFEDGIRELLTHLDDWSNDPVLTQAQMQEANAA